MTTAFPKVGQSIDSWPLFDSASSEGRWAVGSDSIDRYLTVPARSVDAVQLALQLMDGCQTVEDISATVRARVGWEVDVGHLARLAASAGLLIEPPQGRRDSRSQFDRLTLTLFQLPLSSAFSWIERNAAILPEVWRALQAAIALAALSMIALLPARAHSGALPVLAAVIACALSLLAHEASHCFVALKKGIRPVSLSVAIYAGLMPVVYVRLPGIFRLTSADRIRVWIAGCGCNGVIALASNAMTRVPGLSGQSGVFWTYLEGWNVALIIVSLVPFLPTDGYFILSTILRTHNLRSRAYSAAGAIVNGRFSGLDWKPVIFLLAGVATIAAGFFASASQWGKWLQRAGIPPAWGWTAPIVFLLLAWVLRTAGVAINEWHWRKPVDEFTRPDTSVVGSP